MDRNEKTYYQSLYEAAALVNSARTPEDILLAIAETVAKALGAKGCSLMLLTPDKKLLIHAAAYGLSDQYLKKGPVSADESISEALQGKSVVVPDVTTDEHIQYREQAKKEGITSMLCVPITLRDDIIGVVRVYTTEPCHFSEDDIHYVGAVANLGAIALENARLYDSLKRDYDALKHYYFPFL